MPTTRTTSTLCALALAATGVAASPSAALSSVPSTPTADSTAGAATTTSTPRTRHVGFQDVEPQLLRRAGVSAAARISGLPRTLSTGAVAVPRSLAVVGVTWASGTGSTASVSYRTQQRGTWGPWTPLEAETCAACGTGRPGTEAIALTGASHIEVRLTTRGTQAEAPRLSIINPGTVTVPAPAPTAPRSVAAPGAAARSLPALLARPTTPLARRTSLPDRPSVADPRSRSAWGARNTAAMRRMPRLTPRGVVVHHTEGTNSYTPEQVPAIIRGIQLFHTQDRGWSDIGYNVLIDRFGRTWDGRYGGLLAPRVGAHARNVNGSYLGVSYMGNTDREPVTDAGKQALTDVIAWSAARWGFDPEGTIRVGGVRRPALAGHYQVGDTSCPGRDLKSRLSDLRVETAEAAQAYLAQENDD